MKKILLPVLIIALVALLLSSVSGKTGKAGDPAPQVTSVSEAAFSMRATGATDVSTRLVGNFVGENGLKLCFSGSGEVKRVAQNLNSTMGRYALLQSQSGAAILELEMDGGKTLYSFALASPDGDFTLTDGNGAARTFSPVPY